MLKADRFYLRPTTQPLQQLGYVIVGLLRGMPGYVVGTFGCQFPQLYKVAVLYIKASRLQIGGGARVELVYHVTHHYTHYQ